jgi:Type III restriction enzyme, res subunit
MTFITSGSQPARSANPEALFRDLPRQVDGPKHLWAHQADILRDYLNHQNDPDLAIELPTGAGKTLVGMLVGEWRRRKQGERVVYLCPTLQLARQAVTEARTAGIGVVDLTGSNWHWDANDHMAYMRADAIAVAHYGAVFNAYPRLDDAGLLIFDDAHAAAGSIADNWTVRFSYGTPGYIQLVQLLTPGLPGASAARLLAGDHDPKTRTDGYLVEPAVVAANLAKVTEDAYGPATNTRYAWRLLRDSVDACCVFVAADEIIVRPLLPPTFTHAAYTDPKQRLYLSATLGAGGELERAFGRAFPQLTNDFAKAAGDPTAQAGLAAFVSDLMRESGRSLLLTPSNWALETARQELVPEGFTSLSAKNVETSRPRSPVRRTRSWGWPTGTTGSTFPTRTAGSSCWPACPSVPTRRSGSTRPCLAQSGCCKNGPAPGSPRALDARPATPPIARSWLYSGSRSYRSRPTVTSRKARILRSAPSSTSGCATAAAATPLTF